jgi:hypothetical protein
MPYHTGDGAFRSVRACQHLAQFEIERGVGSHFALDKIFASPGRQAGCRDEKGAETLPPHGGIHWHPCTFPVADIAQ